MARILVVDPEKPIRAFIRRILILEQHDVVDVATAADALRAIDSGSFDVIASDVEGIPDMDGDDLLDAIHARAPRTPLVVVTARDDVEGSLREARAGVVDHIAKPIAFGALTSTLRRVLETDAATLDGLRIIRSDAAELYRSAIDLTRAARGRR